jgi:hypothetical protein
MIRPALALEGIQKPAAWEYLLRFMFGGFVTVCTGLIARRCGSGIGGMFLAFPAILPASLTLVKRHDGRACATDDANGARLGALALAGFAAVVAVTAKHWPPVLSLVAASGVWLVIATTLWTLTYGRR